MEGLPALLCASDGEMLEIRSNPGKYRDFREWYGIHLQYSKNRPVKTEDQLYTLEIFVGRKSA